MENSKNRNKIIDFLKFKDTGDLQYIAYEDDESLISRDSLEEISFVMEMSTDELISEMGCRLEYGKSLRDVSDVTLVEELSQRLIAIKFLLAAFTHSSSQGGTGNEP